MNGDHRSTHINVNIYIKDHAQRYVFFSYGIALIGSKSTQH